MSSMVHTGVAIEPVKGEVLISEKEFPICELPEEQRAKEDWCFTRAIVDVSAFKAHLREMPPETWEDFSIKENVSIRRPAHDAWGVKKIIFTFCDDFLQKVRPMLP